MSKFDKKCSKCKNYNGNILICESCAHYKPKPTVFEHITQSVEALAETLVYWDEDLWAYKSIILEFESFMTKSEALVATVAELKNEYKEQSK